MAAGRQRQRCFATSTSQAPKFSELGEPGEEADLRLELRLLADVGVIGFPNAGKSTLIAAVSNARPKIADYPFTTLVPNLGVVRVGPGESFVMADVPGLIEGAHEGAGLGHRFLKHIERTRVLVHMVDCSPLTGRDPFEDYLAIRKELTSYSAALGELPEVVGLNKVDIPEARERAENCAEQMTDYHQPSDQSYPGVRLVSTATGENVQNLIWDAARLRRDAPKVSPVIPEETVLIEGPGSAFHRCSRALREFVVSGRSAERLVAMTDLNNDQRCDASKVG